MAATDILLEFVERMVNYPGTLKYPEDLLEQAKETLGRYRLAEEAERASRGVVLAAPLTLAQLAEQQARHGAVSGVVAVDVGQLMGLDYEGCLDLLSMKLTNTALLEDIGYTVVGGGPRNDQVLIDVSGVATTILAFAPEG